MKLIKLWLLWSMVSTTGLAVTPTTRQINEQPRPIEAEVIEETMTDNETDRTEEKNTSKQPDDTAKPKDKSKAKQKPATDEDTSTEEPYEIDDEEIDECDHKFSKSLATGGEEGDVWEYICDDCGYTYFEPYEQEVTE